MRKRLTLLGLLASLATAYGQGTVLFNATLSGANEAPPNGSSFSGQATFQLDGSSLNILIATRDPMPQPADASINGPASAGGLAPVIFDLGERSLAWFVL